MFFSTPTCHWCPLVTQQWRTAGVLEQLLQFRLLGVQSFTPRLHCLLLSTTQRHVIHGRPSARESRRIRGVVAVIGRPARAHGSRVSSADCSGCWTRWCEVRAARRLSVSGQGCASSCQRDRPRDHRRRLCRRRQHTCAIHDCSCSLDSASSSTDLSHCVTQQLRA